MRSQSGDGRQALTCTAFKSFMPTVLEDEVLTSICTVSPLSLRWETKAWTNNCGKISRQLSARPARRAAAPAEDGRQTQVLPGPDTGYSTMQVSRWRERVLTYITFTPQLQIYLSGPTAAAWQG